MIGFVPKTQEQRRKERRWYGAKTPHILYSKDLQSVRLTDAEIRELTRILERLPKPEKES